MARYRLKRKTFGVVEAARDVVGGTLETAGDFAGSGIGKVIGGTLGAAYAPSILGGIGSVLGGARGLGGVGSVIGKIAGWGPLGTLAGAGLGWGAAKLGGKLLKKTGQAISTE